MDKWQEYRAAYATVDQSTKDKLHSSLIPECVTDACIKYELDKSHQQKMIQFFAFETVGIVDETTTTDAMRAEGIPAAAVIYAEINQCIATKTPAIADTSLVKEEPTVESNQPVVTPTIPVPAENNTPDTLAAELAETEAAFKQIQPIRTMAHDMETIKQEEPIHQATSQEAILNGQGNAEKNAAAQWGTPEK